jgi:hypothetical protein
MNTPVKILPIDPVFKKSILLDIQEVLSVPMVAIKNEDRFPEVLILWEKVKRSPKSVVHGNAIQV